MRPEDLERAKELVARLNDLISARKFYLKHHDTNFDGLPHSWLLTQSLKDTLQNEILKSMNRRIKYVQRQLDAI